MTPHDRQKLRLAVLASCFGVALVLSTVSMQFRPPEPLYYLFFIGAALMMVPAVEAIHWALVGVQRLTGMTLLFTGVGLVMVLVLGLILCPVLIPIRLAVLALQVLSASRP